jgi:hypothetical protein
MGRTQSIEFSALSVVALCRLLSLLVAKALRVPSSGSTEHHTTDAAYARFSRGVAREKQGQIDREIAARWS